MRVLLVADDLTASQGVERMLTNSNFNVYCTDFGEDAIELSKLYHFDMIVLDLNVPDIAGLDVLRQIRMACVDTPFLILTDEANSKAMLQGFGGFADDYLTKPFLLEELFTYIDVATRRSRGRALSVIRTGRIAVNLDAKTVDVEGQTVRLTGKEYQILEILSLRKGTTVTKDMFINHLYCGLDEPAPKIIDVFVCKLRKKLAKATGGENYIGTVWGRGYMLRDPALSQD